MFSFCASIYFKLFSPLLKFIRYAFLIGEKNEFNFMLSELVHLQQRMSMTICSWKWLFLDFTRWCSDINNVCLAILRTHINFLELFVPNIIKINWFLAKLLKNKKVDVFVGTQYCIYITLFHQKLVDNKNERKCTMTLQCKLNRRYKTIQKEKNCNVAAENSLSFSWINIMSYFQDGGCSPSWIFEIEIFNSH